MDAPALMQALMHERARFVRFARGRTDSDANAEDVVHRAFVQAATRAASLQDPARVRAWFYRILRHALADQRRELAKERARFDADGDVEAEPADPSTTEPSPTSCTCALRLLGELRPGYAEVLRRIDVEGVAPEAVAQELGISVGNLHVRLHRARRQLRDGVKDYCGVATHRPCLDCSCDSRSRCSGPREGAVTASGEAAPGSRSAER